MKYAEQMLYRKVPKNSDALSILGYGCMRLPTRRGRVDVERATRQIRHAIDRGVNYVDTARPYHLGGSETFLGQALGDGYRQRVRLATKLTSLFVRCPEDMDKSLDTQLGFLKTDYLDYYLLHGLHGASWKRMRDLGALEFLEKAKADGRIRYTGFSFHGDIDAFKEIVDTYDWEICLIQYNYLDEQNQAGTEGLRYAAGKNLGVMIMEPLRGGSLTLKIPPSVQAIFDRADPKRSPAEWAFRWVWNHPEVTVVLSGMNDERHIDENLRIAGDAHPDSLTEKEREIVREVAGKYQDLMKVACTGCRYCMPCPAGVDIPACFDLYNQRYLFKDKPTNYFLYLTRMTGGMESGKDSYASECTDCGQCADACPQGLPVPDLLKDVRNEFEGPVFRMLVRAMRLFLRVQKWRSDLRRGR